MLQDAPTLHPLFLREDGAAAAPVSGRRAPPAPSVLHRWKRGSCEGREGHGAVVEGVDGEAAEHRDIGAHRFGQDDADGAGAVLHGEDPRDPRGQGEGRSRGEDGFDGFGEGERDYDTVRCHLLYLERLSGTVSLLL